MLKTLFFSLFLFGYVFIFAQAPSADFNATPLSACTNEGINFNSLSSTNGGAAITNYAWDFGDGFAGNGETVSHSYTTPGTYTVTLVVTNANGLADAEIKSNYITIQPSPNASYALNGLGCTVPLTVEFINNGSIGPEYSYEWDFGNGVNSTNPTPDPQNYTSAGSYSVSLIVVNTTTGCSDTLNDELVVSNFQTDFNFPSVVCVGETIAFEDNSTAGANQWSWNFGGQGTSDEQNPSFTFDTPGDYSIQFTSANTFSGCSGSTSSTVTVQATPTPSFTASQTTDCAPATILFNNTSSGGTSYEWNFGDASSTNNTSSENSPSHIYNNNGLYDVSLTMTTSDGCVGTITLEEYIAIEDVNASFSADLTGGCTPLTVTFTDESTPPNASNPIISWEWSFPGGSPSSYSGQNPPPLTYDIGVYDVSLTVTTQTGCTNTIAIPGYITVGEILDLGISVDTNINCIKTDFQFNSFVNTNPSNPDSSEISWLWDFGEGSSTDQNPQYQYSSDTGYFDVQLIVNYRGCIDSIQIDSMVFINAPIAQFAPEFSLYCNQGSSVEVNFTDNATHGIIEDDILMIWQWGDGTADVVLDDPELDDADMGNISHVYNEYGTYTIQQIIHNYTTGCSDSTTSNVDISFVNANFAYSTDSICQGDTLRMFDASTTWDSPPTPHTLVDWEFNMGNTPPGLVNMGDTAFYAYVDPIFSTQNYTITLTATNDVGCSGQAQLPIVVLPTPFPVISMVPDPAVGCAPFDVTFTNSSISFSGIPIDYTIYSYSSDPTIDTVEYIAFTAPNPNPNSFTNTFYESGLNYTTMTVVDEFGCYSSTLSSPIAITKPFASFEMDNVICNGDSLVITNTSDGDEPLSFAWYYDDPDNGNVVTTDTNASSAFTANNIAFGQTSTASPIYLVVTDVNGCKDTSSNLLSISIPWAIPNYSFTGAAIGPNGEYVCPPLFGAYVDSSFSYGQIVEWLWNFGNGNQSILQNPNNTYALPGTYDLYLQVTDDNGCVADTTLLEYVTIGGPSGQPDWIQQQGQCAQGAEFVINNAFNVDSTFWVMGDGISLSDSIDFYYNYADPGTYTPGAYLYDSTGCEVFYPLPPITVLDDGLNAFYTFSPDPAEQNELITFVDGSSSDQSTVVAWIWDFDSNIYSVSSDTNQTYSFPIAGQYPVTLTVYDALGCQDTYSTLINISDPEIWIPNVITINDDGSNDLFVLPFDAFKEFTVFIVNRWGNLIHEGIRDPNNPIFLWDGTADSTGDKVVDGIYFYKINGEMLGGTMVNFHGHVTVRESGQ